MYPAQKLANGIYSADDLPDAVTIAAVSYSRSGTGYGNTTNGVMLEGNVWTRYANGSTSQRPCLIQGGVLDQFADTYYLSATFPTPYEDLSFSNQPLFRTSLCSWISGFYGLYYYSAPLGRDFWLVIFPGIDGTASYNERMNTPVGQYEDRFGVTNIFISE